MKYKYTCCAHTEYVYGTICPFFFITYERVHSKTPVDHTSHTIKILCTMLNTAKKNKRRPIQKQKQKLKNK